jgi:hypothetical protein
MAESVEVVTGRQLLVFKSTERTSMVPVAKVESMVEAYDGRETSQRVIIGKQQEETQAIRRQLDLSSVKIKELEKVKAYYATLELKADKVLEKTTELHNSDVDPIKKVRGQTKLESLIEMSEMRKVSVDGLSLAYNQDRVIWDGQETREGKEKLPNAMVTMYQQIAKNHEWSDVVLESGDEGIRNSFREKYSDVQIVSRGVNLTEREYPELPGFNFENSHEHERSRGFER